MTNTLALASEPKLSFEERHGGRKRWCPRRFARHTWVATEDRRHAWKVCTDCGRKKMTHHIGCEPACWSGPA